MNFASLCDPIVFMKPRRVAASAWLGNVSFAFWIVKVVPPSLLVEPGTHSGLSNCAFCQAVEKWGPPTTCYAVDTWEGDEHTGFYGPEVFRDLSLHRDALYGGFPKLMRMKFEEALGCFSDNSIDLLHIDECHFYEAAKEDCFAWFSKLSPPGTVLLHDRAIREKGFGVWRLVEGVKVLYRVFEFTHGPGLAVALVGSEARKLPLAGLVECSPEQAVTVRRLFKSLGYNLPAEVKLQQLERQLHQILNSRSWRMTAPPKWFRDKLGIRWLN